MERDYSEYKRTEYDRYLYRRSNKDGILLDYFANHVRFNYETKTVRIFVDGRNEYQSMELSIEEYEQEIAERTGKSIKNMSLLPKSKSQNLKKHRQIMTE